MQVKTILLVFSLSSCVAAFSQNPIIIPPVLEGEEFSLDLQVGSHNFFNGSETATMGVNGPILGPTIRLVKGDEVTMNVTNSLGEPTTIHWHGLHVAPENDGGPHSVIEASETWSPEFEVMDEAGTYWYHPHLHEMTNEHASKGISGMIIVEDDNESALELPRTYGVDDFPIVVQTKGFDSDMQIETAGNSDDVLMVNATIDAMLEVPGQLVRLRLLNGSSQRTFNFGFEGDFPFSMIASDGGLLNEPFETNRIELPPGARAEILVDLTGLEGQSINLWSFASELTDGVFGATNPGMMGGMSLDGYNPNSLNGADFQVLELVVGAQTADPVIEIPSELADYAPYSEANADITRSLTFSPATMGMNQLNGNFLINGASFDMEAVNYEIPLGNIEVWEIFNQSAMAHPFHIHDVQFYILDRNGVTPSPEELGRKDVVMVYPMETVRFITRFDDFANPEVPYMYHCHLLAHEDDGMMGQFVVTDGNYIAQSGSKPDFRVYPNPVCNFVNVETFNTSIDELLIQNLLGQIVLSIDNPGQFTTIDLFSFERGLYSIRLRSGDDWASDLLVVQ